MKTICVSGYFNPIHSGHIDYLKAARKLGDKLIVIVNNDEQVKLKGSVPFMDEKERLYIVSNIFCVDQVHISVDYDRSVCKTLQVINRLFKIDIFANGGDRYLSDIPEAKICEELGIEMVFNVGGEKTQSSSVLLNSRYREDRNWGYFEILDQTKDTKVKRLVVTPGESLSMQRHFYRDENWVVTNGVATVKTTEKIFTLNKKDSIHIPRNTWHQLSNFKDVNLEVIEIATGTLIDEDDIERMQ